MSQTFVPTHKTKKGAPVISLSTFVERNTEYHKALFENRSIQVVRSDNLLKLKDLAEL